MGVDSTDDKTVTIKNEALSNERMSFVNKKPGRIVCLIWGAISLLRYVTQRLSSSACRQSKSPSSGYIDI